MRAYAALTLVLMLCCLVLFAIAGALELPILTDPRPWLGRGSGPAALLGLGLLIGDVVLPVPASLVMIANGALFGIALGTLLSLLGGIGAALFGFLLGRRGRSWLRSFIPEDEHNRVEELLSQWGLLAVIVSRPVPILAETVAVLAGGSEMPWPRFFAASVVGCLPAAIIYAIVGAMATNLDALPWILGLVLVIAGSFHALGGGARRMTSKA